MLTLQQVRELSQLKSSTPIVSVYLGVDHQTYPRGEYRTVLKNLIKTQVQESVKPLVEKDLRQIQTFLNQMPLNFPHRSVAIFSSSKAGLWKTYPLRAYIPNRLVVNSTPYVSPLLTLLQAYRRYLVGVIDRKGASIYELFLGDIESLEEMESEVPKKVKAGGYEGREEGRMARHISAHLMHHARKVAEKLSSLLQKRFCHHLILGGSEDVVSALKIAIPSSISNRIIGVIRVDRDESKEEILQRCEPLIRRFEEAEERSLVESLKQESSAGRQGRIGLAPVLQALNGANIHTLLFSEDYHLNGYICKNCKALFTNFGNCQYCGSPTVLTPDVVAEAVEKAFAQGAVIRPIRYDTAFLKQICIGCLLRYSPIPTSTPKT